MKKILFLVEYNEYSQFAFQYALRIAQHFEADIHFAHIFKVQTPLTVGEDFITQEPLYVENAEEFVEEQYELEIERLKSFVQTQVPKYNHSLIGDLHIRTGTPSAEILDIIQQEQMDLVVMGMRQKRKLANALFGNLALTIMEQAPCPVFLVPQQSIYLDMDSIVYASDYEHPDFESLQYLLEWSKVFETVLHVIYIFNQPTSSKPIPYVGAFLDQYQKEVDTGLIEFKFMEGTVKEGIIQYVKECQADMVALTKGNRKFWQSLLSPSITRAVVGEIDLSLIHI